MKKFEFSKDDSNKPTEPTFSGSMFYNVYNGAHFLREPKNIETILSKGHELRRILKNTAPGEVVALNDMFLYDKVPLMVKKTGPNIEIKRHEFTANRLSGLVAAYAYCNRLSLDNIKSSEADILGLKWDNKSKIACKLYLSAVSGTEHFTDQFQFCPLICGIRKLQLKKITIEPVIKMAKIKDPQGICMAENFMKNKKIVNQMWSIFFSESSTHELHSYIVNNRQLSKVFKLNS